MPSQSQRMVNAGLFAPESVAVIAPPVNPAMEGDGGCDHLCAWCGDIVARGVSWSVGQGILLRCAACGTYNRFRDEAEALKPEPHRFEPAGICIYCGAREYSAGQGPPHLEHIVPEGLGGELVLPEASCACCERLVNTFEWFCQGRMLQAFRYRLGIKGKGSRWKRRDRSMPAEFLIGSRWTSKEVPIPDYPVLFLVPVLPMPRLIVPVDEPSNVLQFQLLDAVTPGARSRLLEQHGAAGLRYKSAGTRIGPFVRLLAKIAHSYAVASEGLGSFVPLLLPVIRGEALEAAANLIGGTGESGSGGSATSRHRLSCTWRTIDNRRYLVVKIILFADMGLPEYVCLTGVENGTTPPRLSNCSRPWALSVKDLVEPPAGHAYVHPKGHWDGLFQIGFGG